MEKLSQSCLRLEKPPTLGEAGGGGSRSERRDAPSRGTRGSPCAKHGTPDPNPALFGCWGAPRISKAVKERMPDAANAILSLCQQQCGPRCLATAVCFRPEKSLVGQGRPNTPPVSPRGACFRGCVDTARCRNAASSRRTSRW